MAVIQRTEIAAWALTALGLLPATSHVFRQPALATLAAATAASPLPVLLSEVNGLDANLSEVNLEFSDEQGTLAAFAVTPEIYAKIKGPYSRRLPYGGAISQGPAWVSVLQFAFCEPGYWSSDFGVKTKPASVNVRLKARGEAKRLTYDEVWTLSVTCAS